MMNEYEEYLLKHRGLRPGFGTLQFVKNEPAIPSDIAYFNDVTPLFDSRTTARGKTWLFSISFNAQAQVGSYDIMENPILLVQFRTQDSSEGGRARQGKVTFKEIDLPNGVLVGEVTGLKARASEQAPAIEVDRIVFSSRVL